MAATIIERSFTPQHTPLNRESSVRPSVIQARPIVKNDNTDSVQIGGVHTCYNRDMAFQSNLKTMMAQMKMAQSAVVTTNGNSSAGRFILKTKAGFAQSPSRPTEAEANPVTFGSPSGSQWDEPYDSSKHKPREILQNYSGGHSGPHTSRWNCGRAFNCHSFSLNGGFGDRTPTDSERKYYGDEYLKQHPDYNLDPMDDLIEQGYRKLKPGEKCGYGDLVIYGNDKNGNGLEGLWLSPDRRRGTLEVTHSGIVTKVENGLVTEVMSKWGDGPIWSHHPADVPNIYGNTREYWKAPDPVYPDVKK